MATVPYEGVSMSADKSRGEMQKILTRFGCDGFGFMEDLADGVSIIRFRHRSRDVELRASWKGWIALYERAHPPRGYRGRTAEQHTRLRSLGQNAVAAALRDWVKAQTTIVESGILNFDDVFMPHMLLADGRRVIDAARSQNLLPAPATKP